MQKAAPQAPEVPACGAAFVHKKNHKLSLWKNRAVALMGRKRNSFWELQRRRPLPAAEAGRSCWEPQPVGLPCSSPVPPTTKIPRPNGLAASFLVDIPSRWEPRAKQQPTGLIAYSADWRRQSRPVLVLYRPPQKNPQTEWSGDMVDGTGLEPVTSCTSSRCSTS